MLTLIGLGLAAGVPPQYLALLAVVRAPLPAAFGIVAALATWAISRTQPRRGSEARFFHAVAAELRGGASLRRALIDGAASVPELPLVPVVRGVAVGLPLEALAREFETALPAHGRLAAATLKVAGATGGRAAETFESLAVLSAEDDDLTRERKVATAHARLSAGVVAGLPVGYLVVSAASGHLARLLSTPLTSALLLAGLFLVVLGLVAIWVQVRKVSP